MFLLFHYGINKCSKLFKAWIVLNIFSCAHKERNPPFSNHRSWSSSFICKVCLFLIFQEWLADRIFFFSGMSEDRVSLNGPPRRVFKQSLPHNCFTLQWQPNLRTKHMEHDTCDRFNSMKLKPFSGRQEIMTFFLKSLPVKSSWA